MTLVDDYKLPPPLIADTLKLCSRIRVEVEALPDRFSGL